MNRYLNNYFFTFLVSLLFILCLSSCYTNSKTKINDPLKSFCLIKMSQYYSIDTSEWGLDTCFLNNYTRLIPNGGNYLRKKVSDTIYWHYFNLYIVDNDTFYTPKELYKKFHKHGYQNVLLLGGKSDTLYYYQAFMFGTMRKYFIRGKYFYDYYHGELEHSQEQYFIKHRDSLINIRGNKLPHLPMDPLPLGKGHDKSNNKPS